MSADFLAAGRVYRLRVSPRAVVRSYHTRFTLTGRSRRYRFCGTFPKLDARSPLATAIP